VVESWRPNQIIIPDNCTEVESYFKKIKPLVFLEFELANIENVNKTGMLFYERHSFIF